MSRSYRKEKVSRRHQHAIIMWKSFRIREKVCTHKELLNAEYGDVVFPLKEFNGDWIYDRDNLYYDLPCKIRKEFYTEIQHILNDYIGRWNWDKCRKNYLEAYMFYKGYIKLKKRFSMNPYYYFGWNSWMNTKSVRTEIKKWKGNPIDFLYYLLEHKIIEKALKEYRYYRYNKGR
jgi:hypothetical protein